MATPDDAALSDAAQNGGPPSPTAADTAPAPITADTAPAPIAADTAPAPTAADAAPAPITADATTSWHFRRLMHTKATVGALVIGPAAAVLYADARWDSLTLTVAAPFAGAALVVLFVLAGAGARARKDFFAYFARTRRFSYCDEAEVRPLTPLLRAGDRRQFAHYMEGPLPPAAAGLGCALTHYTFEVERHDDDGRHWESHPFTICVVELECAIQRFSDFFLCSRGEIPGRLGRLLDDEACWIPHSASHALELESSAFADRFELRTRSAQNEIALRQLFSPSFIVWLATHPLAPKFEYSAGTVVLYLDGHIDDGGKLDFFLEAAAQIAGRITAEVRESVAIGR